MDDEIRAENLFLNTVFDGISEEIMVLGSDFTVHNVNRVMLNRYGLKKAEVLGRKCFEVKESCGAPCLRGEANGCPLPRGVKTKALVETRGISLGPDGEQRDLSLIMYPILTPGQERVQYFMEIARDETRFRTLIEKLRASQKRYRAILDTATNAIINIDEHHRITLFNKEAERVFGYSGKEVLGKDLGILIPARYGDHNRYVSRFIDSRRGSILGKTLNLTALRKDGEEIPVELNLSFLEMGSSVTITAIIRDISDRKRLEKKLLQSERLAAVGEAVAHVVHELKNPLMIIGGFTSQIRNTLEDNRFIPKMDMILEEVARLERLVGTLGDFTKEYVLIRRSADVNSVLRDVIRIMAAAYPSERCTFIDNLAPDLDEIVCDPDKLKQVFINVISNGIEAMGGTGTISITSEPTPNGVEIKISDEGRGIPEKDIHNIFEPFFTTRERGSGLGLSISYKIIQAHGGEISAVNRPVKGASFIIRLPGI